MMKFTKGDRNAAPSPHRGSAGIVLLKFMAGQGGQVHLVGAVSQARFASVLPFVIARVWYVQTIRISRWWCTRIRRDRRSGVSRTD